MERYLAENEKKYQSENLNLLDQYYGTAQEQINANREAAIQNADIAYERAKKYLPVQTKANGLSGLGVSETATLDMYNQHLNRKAGIDSTYNASSADLFKNYTTERQSILDKEYEREEAKRLEQKADDEKAKAAEDARKTETYKRFVDMIDLRTFGDVDVLANEINQSYWNGDLTEEDYKSLIQMQNYVRESADYRDKKNNLFWYEDNGQMNEKDSIDDFRTLYNSMSEEQKKAINTAYNTFRNKGYSQREFEDMVLKYYKKNKGGTNYPVTNNFNTITKA